MWLATTRTSTMDRSTSNNGHPTQPMHKQQEPRCFKVSSMSSLTSATTSTSASSFPELWNNRDARSALHRPSANTMIMLVSRSGGPVAKQLVRDVQTATAPPTQECSILARWSADGYYRVVLNSQNCVAVIQQCMQRFPHDAGIQECGCWILRNLWRPCDDIEDSILYAMRLFSESRAVQLAAIQALRKLPRNPQWRPALENAQRLLPNAALNDLLV